MANLTPSDLQTALLRLQSRRLDLISLIMSPRIEEDAPSPPLSARWVLSHPLRIFLAYVKLRQAIRACEALRGIDAN